MKKTLRDLALALCALSLTGCSADFDAQTRSWWLRYHPEENEAYYVEIQDGITDSESAAEPLRRLIEGWRRYPPQGGGFLLIDMDKEIDWESEAEDLPEGVDIRPVKEAVEALFEEVEVVEARLFKDPSGNPGLYRVTRIKDLSVFLNCLNTLFNFYLGSMFEWVSDPQSPLQENENGPSAETRVRWAERITKNKPWLTLQGNALVLDLPLTESEAAEVLSEILDDAESFSPEFWFMRALDQIRIADGIVTLTFAPEGQLFYGQEADTEHKLHEEHSALMEALASDPGFEEFDRAEAIERIKSRPSGVRLREGTDSPPPQMPLALGGVLLAVLLGAWLYSRKQA